MDNNIFSVAIFGCSQLERILITNIFNLSLARLERTEDGRHVGYQIVDPDQTQSVDIILADRDEAEARQASEQLHECNADVPILLISKTSQKPSKPGEFTLPRQRLGGTLLKTLDQVVQKWIQGDRKTDETAINQCADANKAKSCLVVDDSELVRTQMQLLLQDYHLDLCFAEDAETALQMVKGKTFDLTFLDVMLPEMDGYQACKLLKSDPDTSTTPVVMLTSKKSPFNKMHGALVGCDKYLTKPIDANEVHQVLEQYDVLQKFAA